MNKTISMSIRVSEEELDKLKQAARLEAYASYSEFIRRTALIEAENVLKKTRKEKTSMIDQNNFSRVLELLDFVKSGNRYTKQYDDFSCKMIVDFEQKKMIYPDKIKG